MARLDLLTLARIAKDTYGPYEKACFVSRPLTGDWEPHDEGEDDNFLARAYKPIYGKKTVVVAFRGSVPSMKGWKDWVVADVGAIGLSLNALALKLNTAIEFVEKMKAEFPNCWLVGHSLGGAYVQLISAICEVPGTTINAPGVLNLVNQMSSNWGIRLVGAIGGGALSVLSRGITDYFNKAVASFEDQAFASVLNFRGHMDPVSKIGSHVGAPLQAIRCANPWPNPHSLDPIIRTLEQRR